MLQSKYAIYVYSLLDRPRSQPTELQRASNNGSLRKASSRSGNKIPPLVEHEGVYYTPPVDLILRQMNQIHILMSHFFNVRFNIVVMLHLGHLVVSFFFPHRFLSHNVCRSTRFSKPHIA